MDKMHLMNVLIAVGEEQSFAGAARRLAMSPPTVTRAISSLEDSLGVKLIMRTTRSVRFTEAGIRYLDDVRSIMAKIVEADETASGVNVTPQGHINITSPVIFGALFVMPCVGEYLKKFPAMGVSAYFLDRVVNLVDEGMDVAIRIGHLPDSSLKAIRVGSVRRVLCASPEYLAVHGTPKTPDDLHQHTLLATTSISPKVEWKFGTGGEARVVKMNPRLTVTSNEAAIEGAMMGIGVTRLLSYQVGRQLQAGKLVTLLDNFEEEPWPVQVIHREGKYGSSRVRQFIDLTVARLRQESIINRGTV